MSSEDELGAVSEYLRPRFGPLTQIGQGGLCRVYRGFDAARQRPAAVKVLLPSAEADPEARLRFVRELKTLEGWRHPHIIELFECELQPFPWYSMAYVEGFSVKDHLARLGPMETAEALEVALQVLDALDFVHQQGYLHRDLKPGNVLLGGGGRAYLADFGLVGKPESSGLTQIGRSMGTPLYAPPEELAGLGQDFPGDLFSLGLLLFECLTGERYYEVDPKTLRRRAVRPLEEALAPHGRPDLVEVLRTLLAGKPQDRFPSATAAREALAAIARDLSGTDAWRTLSELVHIELVTFRPWIEQLELLARLAPEQRRMYLEDPANLRDLRLPAWELHRRSLRFQDATDSQTIQGVEAWRMLAGDLLQGFDAMVARDAWDQVPEVLRLARRTVDSLRQKLTAAHVRPVEACLAPLEARLRRRVSLVLPDEEPPLYGAGDLAPIRAWLAGVVERAVLTGVGAAEQPSVVLRSASEGSDWILELKGRDVAAPPEAVAQAIGPGPVVVEPGELGGGVRLRIPALLQGGAPP